MYAQTLQNTNAKFAKKVGIIINSNTKKGWEPKWPFSYAAKHTFWQEQI